MNVQLSLQLLLCCSFSSSSFIQEEKVHSEFISWNCIKAMLSSQCRSVPRKTPHRELFSCSDTEKIKTKQHEQVPAIWKYLQGQWKGRISILGLCKCIFNTTTLITKSQVSHSVPVSQSQLDTNAHKSKRQGETPSAYLLTSPQLSQSAKPNSCTKLHHCHILNFKNKTNEVYGINLTVINILRL